MNERQKFVVEQIRDLELINCVDRVSFIELFTEPMNLEENSFPVLRVPFIVRLWKTVHSILQPVLSVSRISK